MWKGLYNHVEKATPPRQSPVDFLSAVREESQQLEEELTNHQEVSARGTAHHHPGSRQGIQHTDTQSQNIKVKVLIGLWRATSWFYKTPRQEFFWVWRCRTSYITGSSAEHQLRRQRTSWWVLSEQNTEEGPKVLVLLKSRCCCIIYNLSAAILLRCFLFPKTEIEQPEVTFKRSFYRLGQSSNVNVIFISSADWRTSVWC